jgi:hypothetical protein
VRSLYGIVFFVGVALLMAARMWPPDALFAQELPAAAVATAAMWTPLFATWAMPTRKALIVYPVAVVTLWHAAGYAGHSIFPEPPPDAGYICGLPFFAMMMLGLIGIVTGVIGRAIGLSVRDSVKSAVVTYFIQLIPFGALAALVALML